MKNGMLFLTRQGDNRYSNYRNYRGHSKWDHPSKRGALGGVYVRRM